MKCFRCFKKGHIAKNCIEEEPKQCCNFCQGEHHHSVCDSSPCFKCCQPGHISQVNIFLQYRTAHQRESSAGSVESVAISPITAEFTYPWITIVKTTITSRIGSRKAISRNSSVSAFAKTPKDTLTASLTSPKINWSPTQITTTRKSPNRKGLKKSKEISGWKGECMGADFCFTFLCEEQTNFLSLFEK